MFDGSSKDWSHQERSSSSQSGKKEEADPQDSSKSSSAKSFTADLQSFLQEAFGESFERQMKEKQTSSAPAGKTASSGQAPSGLDALIRNTLEPASFKLDPNATRRLVVTFRETQLQKLKNIAKLEKTYLKQIINEIVESYIDNYEKNKGRIN